MLYRQILKKKLVISEEEHYIEQSYHSTDTEQELEETCEQETTNNLIENDSHYLVKDGIIKWHKNKGNTSVHTCSHNIVIHLPRAKGSAKTCKTPLEFFNLFISKDIKQDIIKYTNLYIERVQMNIQEIKTVKKIDENEVNASIG
ncbi:DDE_Tnp_1_7 domain-containing protein [Trichonephila clavipes]|uniref:DDE_Tnp_1_7 domain-containing protein n=1 Tax=Trichonephila clavipes TaxID=2585209 RepID=A0A8X6RDK8_TRICX|nr:DDE_Tnp_1_7 domain-containing protein [Trichonephila clavipes]